MKRNSAELKRLAREILTHRYGTPMAAMVIAELITALLLLPFSSGLTVQSSAREWTIYYVAFVVVALLGAVLSAGNIYIALRMARKQEYRLKDLFYGFSQHPDKYILATILLALIGLIPMIPLVIVAICIGTSGGSVGLWVVFGVTVLLLLIGELYISMRYALVLYLILDFPETGVTEVFRISREWMSGNKGRLLYISFSFIGWELLAILSFGVGYLWIAPYIQQTLTCFYMDVQEEHQNNNREE